MKIVPIDYQGSALQFQEDGWFNANDVAAKFGKRVDHWLANKETKEYIDALCRITNTRLSGYLKTKRGASGGTWFHPRLGVRFAQWLDPEFAIWCDTQIDSLLRGKSDWRKERHQAAASFRVMNDVLKLKREDDGKETANHHYSNEARLINWLMSGQFGKLDREALSAEDLSLLAHLEEKNAVLIGGCFSYDERKGILERYAKGYRTKRLSVVKAA